MLATQCPALCCSLKTNFLVISKFNCWWETFILLQKNVEPWIPERSWVLIDHVSFGWGDTSCSQVFSCKPFVDFFLDRWEVFILHPSTKNPDSCQALFEFIEWWLVLFEWAFTSYNQDFSCKPFVDFFLDRWEVFVLHPSTKNPNSCQALLNSIDWWLIMSHLNEVIQVAARSLAVSNSVTFFSTDERCLFFSPPQKIPTAVKHFWIHWVMTDHVLFEWGHTIYYQVLSCKQFGDFFSTDQRCSFFILPQKLPIAIKHFLNCIDGWWCSVWMRSYKLHPAVSNSLTFFSTNERCSFFIPPQNPPTAVNHFQIYWVMSHLDEVIQAATRSLAVSNLVTFLSTDEQCLPSRKNSVNATVLSLPIQVLVHAGCSCRCQGRGLAGCRPQSVGRCPEADGVIKQLLISQRWVQV